MIAITFALPAESSGFLSRISDKTPVERNSITTILGHIENNEVEILHTGVGEKICQHRIENFLQDQNFKFLISSGFAGAVTEDFRAGDLILAENFSEPRLLSAAVRILPDRAVHIAKLVTSTGIIDSRTERNAIAGVSGGAAIDMETKTIADACATRGIPLLSLRVISDTPGEPLPAPPNVLFDLKRQGTPFGEFLSYLLKHPMTVPRLIKFSYQIRRARKSLTESLITLVKTNW
jgi:adenosylhomocysteine nucleosidase